MSVFPLFAAWRARVPVRICHNHTTAHWGEGLKTLLKYILRPFNKLFAAEYFACGEAAGRWMYGDRCFDAGKVTVMPNAIDTGRFAFDPEAGRALREKLGIPPGAFVIGHVGRFMYQKNHDFLVDIFAEVLSQKPEARLLLIGEGSLMGQVREKADRLGIGGKVIFTGARADVDKLYSVMDLFCLPSFYEGMPVVSWEAQANGLPCVFSDRVSREAGRSEDCRFLPLALGAKGWAEALLEGGPRERNAVPEIRQCAAWLAGFYTEADSRASV